MAIQFFLYSTNIQDCDTSLKLHKFKFLILKRLSKQTSGEYKRKRRTSIFTIFLFSL